MASYFAKPQEADRPVFDLSTVPEYSGEAWAPLNGNVPEFTEEELTAESYELYGRLDHLGRCGTAMASVGLDLMPTEPRGEIGSVKPTGWHSVKHDFVDGKSLYNRCHLIGFQLTGENANELNLITGTRYLNVEGMLPFENMIADYVKETGNHVLYRVTPVFSEDELVARGVQLEAMSVEDKGEGVSFNVYCYNVQPGVILDYATGESSMDEAAFTEGEQHDYVLNTSSKKFHLPDCSGAQSMSAKNRQDYTGTREMLIAQGFEPCSSCKP
ncbi:MAG: DNA/RNA non-specific endonuclease [Candidatus Heteroscillospira sp.]